MRRRFQFGVISVRSVAALVGFVVSCGCEVQNKTEKGAPDQTGTGGRSSSDTPTAGASGRESTSDGTAPGSGSGGVGGDSGIAGSGVLDGSAGRAGGAGAGTVGVGGVAGAAGGAGITPTACIIDSVTYPSGAVNPSSSCQACNPSESTKRWSGVVRAGCVQAISASELHTCAIVNGAAKCWGENAFGALGSDSVDRASSPMQVKGLTSGVTAISARGYHSCAIVNGAAKCWGYNLMSSLGDGTTTNRSEPVQVEGLTSGVTAIGVGNTHGCAIVNGAVRCWGGNLSGELGNGSGATVSSSPVPVAVDGLSSGVTALSVGDSHSCAIVGGGVRCWGDNYDGGLGDNSTTNSPIPIPVRGLTSGATAVSAGEGFSCAIVNGGVVCWGLNTEGQLGQGNRTTSLVPVAVQGLPSGVTALSVGYGVACAIASGKTFCWGDNNAGQLGTGTKSDYSLVPVEVNRPTAGFDSISAGEGHTCATSSGEAYCWGNYSVPAANGEMTGSAAPVAVVF